MSMSGEAYGESGDRRPTNREAVLARLLQSIGEWIPGYELEKVGGSEATRRAREIRAYLRKRGGFEITVAHVDGSWCYRLTRTAKAA